MPKNSQMAAWRSDGRLGARTGASARLSTTLAQNVTKSRSQQQRAADPSLIVHVHPTRRRSGVIARSDPPSLKR